MKYQVEFKPRAQKDLKALQSQDAARVMDKIGVLQENLTGDVKKLTNFTPEYRLRVGDFRVLFEVSGQQVIIYRVRHRKDVYR